MKKNCLKLIALSLIFAFSLNTALAASLSLTYIGALGTNGSKYTEWWYTGMNPVFKGTAGTSASVKIKLDSTEYSTQADSSGNWSYASTLPSGDHIVVISSGSEIYSFTLHLGQNIPGDANSTTSSKSQSTSAVPTTGFNQTVGITTALVLIGTGMYSYYTGMKNRKRAHVECILKSLDK